MVVVINYTWYMLDFWWLCHCKSWSSRYSKYRTLSHNYRRRNHLVRCIQTELFKIKFMGYIIGKVSLIVIHYWSRTYRAQTHSRKTVGGRALFIRKCCNLKNAKMVNFVFGCKGRSTCTLTKPVDSSPWNSAPIHLIGKNIVNMINWSWGTSSADYLAAIELSPPTERACDLQSYYSLHYN